MESSGVKLSLLTDNCQEQIISEFIREINTCNYLYLKKRKKEKGEKEREREELVQRRKVKKILFI